MNFALMEEIIRHVFANLAVVPNPAIDENKTASIRAKEFILPETLTFVDEHGKEIKNSIWGCYVKAAQGDEGITMLLGDCTQYSDIPEFCLVVQLKNAPAYGLYLVYNDLKPEVLSDPLISVSVNSKDWMPCDTYLQGTFLAAMESIRDLNLGRHKPADYKTQYELMLSLIKFYHLFYGSV
jgi:hypothetical protein